MSPHAYKKKAQGYRWLPKSFEEHGDEQPVKRRRCPHCRAWLRTGNHNEFCAACQDKRRRGLALKEVKK